MKILLLTILSLFTGGTRKLSSGEEAKNSIARRQHTEETQYWDSSNHLGQPNPEVYNHPEKMTADFKDFPNLHPLVVHVVLKASSHFFIQRVLWAEVIVVIVLLASAYTVSMAGHHVSQWVFIEGVGPQGRHLEKKSGLLAGTLNPEQVSLQRVNAATTVT